MKVLGIIPARFKSTRLPGKPLQLILGKTMIQRVFEQCKLAKSLDDVIVATDDERIYNHVIGFGGKAMMTSLNLQNGTERCAEVAANLPNLYEVVINIQGDEPFIDPKQIDELAEAFSNPSIQIATQKKRVDELEELEKISVIKVVTDKLGDALYFSRTPIPFLRNHEKENWLTHFTFYKHIGIYAFRPDVLQKLVLLSLSDLEDAESLEQLRWLENGFKISVNETTFESMSIDTPADLQKANSL